MSGRMYLLLVLRAYFYTVPEQRYKPLIYVSLSESIPKIVLAKCAILSCCTKRIAIVSNDILMFLCYHTKNYSYLLIKQY